MQDRETVSRDGMTSLQSVVVGIGPLCFDSHSPVSIFFPVQGDLDPLFMLFPWNSAYRKTSAGNLRGACEKACEQDVFSLSDLDKKGGEARNLATKYSVPR